jgi:two-component system, OmpR family, response regulator
MRSVLYVDDDRDIRTIAKLALSLNARFQVRTAASGQEGLEVARAFLPDLIMLDVMMPGMDGPAFFVAARSDPVLMYIPIIFITARIQTHQVTALMALGALGVISKPFDPVALSVQVLCIVEKHRPT